VPTNGQLGVASLILVMADYPEVPEPDQSEVPGRVSDPTIEMLDVEEGPRSNRVLKVLGVFALLALVAFVGVGFYAQRQFASVEKVDLSELLSPSNPSGVNYLIVGSDSRENLDRNIENAGAIFGDGTQDIAGQRTDTIQILRISNDGTQHILALPRDLYLPIGGDGARNRINAAYAFGGPELLISTIQGSLGIPIHHYAEVDFAGFIDLVDAVGGVTIDFQYPAHDAKTGLNVTSAGPVSLDSAQALAFVRSRNYTEVIDGQNVVDRRGDLGRVKRQQVFLQSLFDELGGVPSLLSALPELGSSAGSFKIDSGLSFTDALGLAADLRGFEPNNNWDLVVTNVTVSSGAQVLQLNYEASQSTLEFFSG
jgi:LCP family protein required for cell wall assembly